MIYLKSRLLSNIKNMKDLQQAKRRAYFKNRYKRDYSVIILVAISAVVITAIIFGLMRAVDLWAVRTCDQFNDCEVVLSHINK